MDEHMVVDGLVFPQAGIPRRTRGLAVELLAGALVPLALRPRDRQAEAGEVEVWMFGGLDVEMFKHRQLEVWQEARALVKRVYTRTAGFPKTDRFGLCDQIQRAAVSVPSNIAEGSSRESPADFIHFLVIARGSLSEIDTQLTLAEDLGYVVEDQDLHSMVESLAKRITALISHVRAKR